MKKMVGFLACGALLLTGCGRRKEVKVERHHANSDMTPVPTEALAEASFEQFIFDDTLPSLDAEFTFLDSELMREEAYLELDDEVTALAQMDVDDMGLDDSLFDWDEDEVIFEPLQFGFESDMLLEGQEDALAENVALAKEVVEDGDTVVVCAYACQMGPQAYNLALTQRRANAVKKTLVDAGVPAGCVAAVGRGQTNFVVTTNETERMRQVNALAPNRRAEMTVVPCDESVI